MEPGSLHKFLILSFFLTLPLFTAFGATSGGNLELEYDENSIAQRMESMPGMTIKLRRNPVAMSYIRAYLTKRRRSTELIIGRSLLYFPLFEQQLARHNLPAELKYLPVVESALNPRAVSPAGAGGLWQFMPATGRLEGLQANKYLDERFDPTKSTEAAMRHLRRLYNMFDDWELVLAAYNSGSGTVNRAIKRGRSRDYWKIQRLLPRETRNYVPAFIAATYVCEHYDLHGIEPNVPDLDIQLTGCIKVYNGFGFYEIATLTGLSIEMVETLNPAYVGGYIPENAEGYYLTLPRRVLPAVMEYLAARLPDNTDPEPVFAGPVALYNFPRAESYYIQHTYTIEEEDGFKSINDLAAKFNCTPYHLRVWNPDNQGLVAPGQQWVYFGPKAYKRLQQNKKPMHEAIAALPSIAPVAVAYTSALDTAVIADQTQRYICIQVGRNERLPDIARRYEGVSLDELRRLNRVMGNPVFRSGRIVKIKEL